MQELKDNQQILNSAMDKQNVRLNSVSKSGNKQFLQYYIDNNKLSQLLPIQIILNSIFDRQTASICINNSVSDNSQLTNYIGNVNISTSDGKNTFSSTDDNITIGNIDANVSIDAQNVTLNGNSLNTPNGFVTLNNDGFIDNQFISLQFDPKNLSVVQNVFALPTDQVQITIKNTDGTYQAITLSQLATLCYPQLQYL